MHKKNAVIIRTCVMLMLLFAIFLGSCAAEKPETDPTAQATDRTMQNATDGTRETEDFQVGFDVISKETAPTSDTTTPGTTAPAPDKTTPGTTAPADGTENPETTPPTTAETKPSAGQDTNAPDMDYEEYMALSPEEQQKLFDRYFADDPLAFAEWYKGIKQAYDDENPSITVTGPIDIEDILNPTKP